jgi:RNA polymerase sigma-70 factor (ECF subfamily)
VHSRLREIAGRLLQPAGGYHTLEPSALVNELCIRLIGNQTINYNNRAHFFAVAAQTMRRILIDHARAGLAEKRGGEQERVSLSGIDGLTPVPLNEDMLALDEALSKLATLDPRAARVLELRLFGGLEENQVADVLGVSAITVKRDWKAARACGIRLSDRLRPRHTQNITEPCRRGWTPNFRKTDSKENRRVPANA